MAFHGEVELDLRACQLAVVSRLWNVDRLHAFLRDHDKSIWNELLSWVEVSEDRKDIIKRTVYSIIFGMSKRNMDKQLELGTSGNEGIGKSSTVRFFKHPSVLASIVQSWELRIMLAMLSVFESNRQLTVLSWLHDGCTVHLGDKTKRDRHIRQLCSAIEGEAKQHKIPTFVEVKDLF